MARKSTQRPKDAPPAPFDRLRRDCVSGGYGTKVPDRGRTIWVRFQAESRAELQALLPTAVRFWRARARWFKAFREYAARELLDKLNGFLDYGQEDPPVITASQVRKFLKAPFTVEFRRDEDDGPVYFELSGGEDDALQEHCFEVIGRLDTGIEDGDVRSLF